MRTATPIPRPLRRRAIAMAALLALAAPGGTIAQSQASSVDWVDWVGSTDGSVSGVMLAGPGRGALAVTFSGNYQNAFTGDFAEPYWGPTATYTGGPFGPIANAPRPGGDAITIVGGPGRMTLSFSEPVTNPVIAIASLGLLAAGGTERIQTSMLFEQPFEILTNGPNFYANGLYTPFTTPDGRDLFGIESSGVIRFNGTFSELAWTSPLREVNVFGNVVGTYLFTVGNLGCGRYELRPNPLGSASTVPAGCNAFTTGSFLQDAALDVRGALTAQGTYRITAPMTVAAGGRFDHWQTLDVAAGQTLTLGGQMNGTAAASVDGRIVTLPGSQWTAGQLFVSSGGELSVGGVLNANQGAGIAGTLRVTPGGTVLAQAPVIVGSTAVGRLVVEADGTRAGQFNANAGMFVTTGSSVEVGGTLRVVSGLLSVDQGTLTVLPGGTVSSAAPVVFDGTVSNRGTIEIAGTTAGDGFHALVSNQGRIALSSASARFDSGLLNNFQGGRIELVGSTLTLDGAIVSNLGAIDAAAGSQIVIGNSHLNNVGTLSVRDGATLHVATGSVGNSGQVSVNGRFLNQGVFRNEGSFSASSFFGDLGFDNQALFENTGTATIGGGALPTLASNTGVLRNEGTLVVAAGSSLSNQNTMFNEGTLRVDGVLSIDGGSFQQGAAGRTVVNGTLRAPGGFLVEGGRVGGSGTLQGFLVLGTGSTGGPGNSPGTLTVTGDVTLRSGATLELEMGRDGRHDQLRTFGTLRADEGSAIRLVFAEAEGPDIDQTFALFDAANLDIAGAALEGLPNGQRIDTYARAGAEGRTVTGWAFTPESALHVDAGWFGPGSTVLFVNPGQTLYADTPLGAAGATLVISSATLGLRRDASFRAGVVQTYDGGRFLVSSEDAEIGRLAMFGGEHVSRGIERIGTVSMTAAASWTNHGDVTIGLPGTPGEVMNAGRVVHAGGRWTFAGDTGSPASWRNLAGASLEIRGPMAGPVYLDNQGSIRVERGARLQDVQALAQSEGETIVDGELAGQAASFGGGLLGGRGRIDVSYLSLGGGARLQPGRAGAAGFEGGTLTFALNTAFLSGAVLEFVIAGADRHGRLSFEEGAVFEPGSALLFVLDEGFLPGAALTLSLIDLGEGRALDGFADAIAAGRVVTRSAAGDQPWDGSWTLAARAGGMDLVLTPSPVPEPAAAWLALGGALVLVLRRKAAARAAQNGR